MPTYVYRCKICQITHTHTHGMNENPLPACPRCGGFSEKVASGPPVVKRPAPEQPKVIKPDPADEHDCGSSCALHRYP